MIVHPPIRTAISSKEVQISSEIEWKNRKSTLWFRFPAEFNPSTDCDPFVVALLLAAMQTGEAIEVRGTLSSRLAVGLKEYQRIYQSWYPERFREIEIRPVSLRLTGENSKRGVACAFSGGVDSFYTLLKLREEGERKLTHAVFMAGFDMPINLTRSINELTQSYSELMKMWGIQFVVGSTNVREFVNTVDWTNAHGQALAAAALFFSDQWDQFYIPSSYTANSYPKWGTHPSLDGLLSTESLKFIHHGTEANRVQKLAVISRVSESYCRLRVCWIQDIGLRNCGGCEKCIRTMVALQILGRLASYTTFPQPLARSQIRGLKMRTHQARLFAHELIREAAWRGKFSICQDLALSLIKRRFSRRVGPYVTTKKTLP